MAFLITPRGPLTQQPQYPAPIDWGNPITRGLIFAWGGWGDSVSGSVLTRANAVTGPLGSGQRIVNSQPLVLPGLPMAATNELTMLALVSYPSLTANVYGGLFGKWDGLNNQRPGFGTFNGTLLLSNNGGSDAPFTGSIPSSGSHTLMATQLGNTASAYVDGVLTSAVSGTTRTWLANSDAWRIGCFRGGNTAEAFDTGTIYLAAAFSRGLSAAEAASLAANPWQIFQAPRRLSFGVAAVQLLRPSSDISAGAWTPSSGVNLFATINEVVADDATFDLTSQASTFEVGIAAGTSPGVTTGHVVRYRLIGAVTVSLRQGTTTIASWAQAPTAMTTYVQTLTSPQAAAITNYAALSLQFQAT